MSPSLSYPGLAQAPHPPIPALRRRPRTRRGQIPMVTPITSYHLRLSLSLFFLSHASQLTEDQSYQRYLKNKYNDSPDLMNKYTTVMTALGKDAGIHFKFCGTIASTLDAHRVIQWAQEKYGEEVAERIVMCKLARLCGFPCFLHLLLATFRHCCAQSCRLLTPVVP